MILALDQGGHASRAVCYGPSGNEITQARVPVATHVIGDDRVEHDADEIVSSLRIAAQEACDASRKSGHSIEAVGIATQRSTIVCWDKNTGRALSPAISWQDRRGHALVEELRDKESQIRRISGLVLSPHYGASKLRWCLENLAEVRAAQARGQLLAGPLSAFLLARLLAEKPALVDPANAARTQLFEPSVGNWSEVLLDAFGVPASVLPRCVSTRHPFGMMRIGQELVPLQTCTGDQAAVPFAFGPPARDTAYVNAGTGAFVQRITTAGSPLPAGLLRSVLCSDDSNAHFSLEGTVNGAGSAIEWLGAGTDLDVNRALEELPERDGAEPPLFMNGVGGLGSPFWDPDFPAEFVGMGDDCSQLHAVVDSIAFLLNVNLELMAAAEPIRRIVITGGFAGCDYFCRALADLSQVAVERYFTHEATARGTAYLAAGLPDDWQPVPLDRVFTPSSNPRLDARFSRWRQAIQQRGARASQPRIS